MKTAKIRLGGVEDIRAFVNAAAMYEYDVDLRGGRYVVDGKSIMGIFSLDLSKPITLHIHADDANAESIVTELAPYLV